MKTAHVGLIRENRLSIQAGPRSEQTPLEKSLTKKKKIPSINSKNDLLLRPALVTVGFKFHSLTTTAAAHRHESSVAAKNILLLHLQHDGHCRSSPTSTSRTEQISESK